MIDLSTIRARIEAARASGSPTITMEVEHAEAYVRLFAPRPAPVSGRDLTAYGTVPFRGDIVRVS